MFRFLSLTAQMIYYRQKARYWRRRVERLEKQLEGERWRNQHREDELLVAPLRFMGLYGLNPRTGPAPPRIPLASQPEPLAYGQPQSLDPWDQLTPFEQAEFAEIYWRADGQGEAQQAGVSLAQARYDFAKQIIQNRVSNRLM